MACFPPHGFPGAGCQARCLGLPHALGPALRCSLSAAPCRCPQDAGGPAEGRGLLPQPDAADEDPVPDILCQPPVGGQRPHGAQVRLMDFFPGGGGGRVLGFPPGSSFLSNVTWNAVQALSVFQE